jgi:hypothetical protein
VWAAIKDITDGRTENYQLLCANCHAVKTWEDARSAEIDAA